MHMRDTSPLLPLTLCAERQKRGAARIKVRSLRPRGRDVPDFAGWHYFRERERERERNACVYKVHYPRVSRDTHARGASSV